MPFTLYHFLTANWHYVPTVIYIASCLYLKLVLYLLNINSKTRYSNPWITPRVYRNLQKYLKRWRFMMAHLNEQIDVYFKVHYRVSEYNLRTLSPRTTIIPDRQYHAIRRRRQHRARQACLRAITLTDSNHGQPMAMATSSTCAHRVHFDTDFYDILVDNCCSKSITNCLGDFITPPRSSRMIIKGFNGATATTKVGTVQWKLQDDTGMVHTITLPETYYSERVETRLLSPQHWAQVARQGKGTKCTTYHDCIVLSWGKGQYQKTIPLSSSNVGVITAPPGITSFLHTCKHTLSKYPLICFPSTTASPNHLPVVSNIDDDPDQPLTPPDQEPAVLDQPTESTKHNEHNDTRPNETVEEDRKSRNHPIITAFDQEQHDIANDHPTYMDEHQEYMKWHCKLNHASQRVMTKLAHKGMLPRTITKILRSMDKQGRKGPMCNDCYSASATRTPWRTKPDKHMKNLGDRKSSLSPGDVVSVD
jgi:hypothetical protein